MDKIGSEFIVKGGTKDAIDLKSKKIIGIYFSAHWCPPCRAFTPNLAKAYKAMKEAGNDIEIIFATFDQSEEEFKSYFADMPWIAFPHGDKRIKENSDEYGVSGIPCLVILKDGVLLTKDGRMDVAQENEGAYAKWIKWSILYSNLHIFLNTP